MEFIPWICFHCNTNSSTLAFMFLNLLRLENVLSEYFPGERKTDVYIEGRHGRLGSFPIDFNIDTAQNQHNISFFSHFESIKNVH